MLIIFLFYRLGFSKERKEKSLLYIDVFQMFLKCFYDNTIKIVLILAPGREFSYTKYVQFLLTTRE